MKKILKLVLILSLLTVAFVACKKDKGQAQTDSNQPQTEQNYNYEKMLYINEARFNASGDLIVLFSGELDKNQNLKDFVEVEGLDNSNMTIMPFINKIIIKGNFQKEVPYNKIGVKNINKSMTVMRMNNVFSRKNIESTTDNPCISKMVI